MQFSAFERTVSGNTILFKNIDPIENVKNITTFEDNSNGSFLKKEIRWTFNQIYWSSWQTLTPHSISAIDTRLNPYLYLEVRYVLNAVNSGIVTSFLINYNKFAPTVIPSTEVTPSPSTEVTPLIDIIKKYEVTEIYDVSLLNSFPGSYYLARVHHIGQQPIGSITGLRAELDSLKGAAGITYEYVDGSFGKRDASIVWLYENFGTATGYLKESSIGTGFIWNNGKLDVSSGSGDITKVYVDASLLTRDSSITELYNTKSSKIDVNASLNNYYTKIYVDSSFATITNVESLKTYVDGSLSILNASVGLALQPYVTNASVGTALNSYALKTYVDGSITTAIGPYATNASVGTALNSYTTKTYVDGSLYTLNASVNSALLTLKTYVDGSLGVLNASVNTALTNYTRKTYVDGSLSALNASVNTALTNYTRKTYVDGSLATLNASVNTALSPITSRINYVDACLGSTSTLAYSINSSLNNYSTITYVDASLSQRLKEASLGNSFLWTNGVLDVSLPGGGVTQAYVDTADNLIKATYIPDASLNDSKFKWVNGVLEPSVQGGGGISQEYVDGSLATLNASVNTALGNYTLKTYVDGSLSTKANDGSLGNYTLKTYVDGSLSVYTRKTYVDGSLATLNASVNSAFVSNSSLGLLTTKVNYIDSSLGTTSILSRALNSSINNYATNASVNTAFSSNASLGLLTTKINYIDASLGTTSILASAVNASLNNYATLSYVNASLNQRLKEASLGTTFLWSNGVLDVSLPGGGVTQSYVDTADNLIKAKYIPDSSLNQSKFKWVAGVLEPSVQGGGGVSQEYVDGSLSTLNASVNTALLTNVSLGNHEIRISYIDACLGPTSILAKATNSSINNYATNASVNSAFLTNASLGNYAIRIAYLDACLGPTSILAKATNASINNYATNASVNNAFLTNASLGNHEIRINYLDVSLGTTSILTRATNASINNYATNASVNNAFLTNSSLGNLTIKVNVVDSSLLYVKAAFIPDSSLNQSKFKWVAGVLEPSVQGGGGVSQEYVDGSLATLNASVNTAFLTNASISNYAVRIAYLDSCLGTTSILTRATNASLNNYATNASVNTAFLTNSSLGNLTIRVSALDSSLVIFSDSYIPNASLNQSKFKWVAGVLEPSVQGGGVTQAYVDTADDAIKAAYIPDSSLNQSKFKWVTGVLEPSVAGGSGVSQEYVDGSILALNASIGYVMDAYIPNASLNQSKFKWVTGVLEPSILGGSSAIYTTPDGSVAIGNGFTSPSYLLEVSGNLRANNYAIDASSGTANMTTSGIIINLLANTDVSFGDVAYIGAGGRAYVANAAAIATANAIVMCADVSIPGMRRGMWMTHGTAKYANWNWTIGGLVYLNTGGLKGQTLTQSQPVGANNVIQIIGVALSPDSILFTPSLVQVEHV